MLTSSSPPPEVGGLDHYRPLGPATALEGVAQCADRWGFDHAVRALEEAVAAERIQTADIVALGRRMALAPLEPSNVVDLLRYDTLLAGRVGR